MARTIFIGNLPWAATEEDLIGLVSPHARVVAARIAVERETGRSRGFGFVEIDDADLEQAVAALQQTVMAGRLLTVNEARARPPRG